MKTLPMSGDNRLTQPNIDQPESWKQHLRNWSIFAAAAGAALATASRADADIIFSGPVNLTVTPGAPNAKTFSINHHSAEIYGHAYGRRAVGYLLFPGQQVANNSNGLILYGAGHPVGHYHFYSGGGFGERGFGPSFFGTGAGFAGVQTAGGDLGWIDIKVTSSSFTVVDFAYNNVPGAPILTGQTTAVPEPSSLPLGLLAAGASGLIAWRKRRAQRQP